MIDIETVFVLGAGASKPYRYPTGDGLRKYICSTFATRFNDVFYKALPGLKSTWMSKASELARIFEKSTTPSIDLFLSRNKRFSDVGKIAIILSILDAERASKFRDKSEIQEHDWYTYIFHRMTKTLIDPDSYKNFGNNKVTFITFNYDRSLEQFLYESFVNSFSEAGKNEIINEIKKISIFHVYGKVSNLQWEGLSDTAIEYLSENDDPYRRFSFDFLQNLKDNIKIIHERKQNDCSAIHERLSAAKRVYFLGFGYATENLEALEIKQTLSDRQQIFGTAFNLLDKEIQEKRALINANFRIKDLRLTNPKIIDADCVRLLREYL